MALNRTKLGIVLGQADRKLDMAQGIAERANDKKSEKAIIKARRSIILRVPLSSLVQNKKLATRKKFWK